MTDYCTLADVRLYQHIGSGKTAHDSLLNDLISKASARIDRYCNRTFVAASATRKFHGMHDVDSQTLYLDEDLVSVTSITNGDGTTLSASDYVLEPTNRTPKFAVRLKASSSKSWTWTTDPEEAISVAGLWGYASTQPPDIKHAAVRLVAWYFAQRDAPFEAQGLPELGIVTVPSDIPADIKATLDPYVRRQVR